MQKEFTLAVTLKQHTPLIHFQYKGDTETGAREQNATLRATEVKPRLDKFIKDNTPDGIPAHWKVGKVEDKNKHRLRL